MISNEVGIAALIIAATCFTALAVHFWRYAVFTILVNGTGIRFIASPTWYHGRKSTAYGTFIGYDRGYHFNWRPMNGREVQISYSTLNLIMHYMVRFNRFSVEIWPKDLGDGYAMKFKDAKSFDEYLYSMYLERDILATMTTHFPDSLTASDYDVIANLYRVINNVASYDLNELIKWRKLRQRQMHRNYRLRCRLRRYTNSARIRS